MLIGENISQTGGTPGGAFSENNAVQNEQCDSTPESWQQWLASHGDAFFLYARQQARSEADAQDVLQEALFETWRRTGGKPPDNALVFATIRRRAMDLARSADRRAAREIAAHDPSPFLVPDFGATDAHAQLAASVGELPDHLREAVMLKIWGDLSFPEIGAIMGVSENTAASRYRYALERLREHLIPLLK